MPSNSVGGVSVTVRLDDKDALQQLNKLRQKILSLQSDLDSKRAQRDVIAERLRIAGADADAARLKVEELKAALATAAPGERASLRAQLTDANAVLREQTAIVNKLDDQYVKLTNDIGTGEKNLAGMQNSAAGLEQQLRASGGAVAQLRTAAQNATKAMERGFARLGSMIKRVFIFTVALRALRAIRSYLSEIFLSFPEVREILADIKGNLLTALAPIVQALIPPLMTLLSVLRDVAAVLADIVSKIFGMTAAQAQDAAKGLNKQAEAYKKTGGAAAKAAKQLASFDQLNILNDPSSGGGGGSGGGIGTQFGTDFTTFLKDQLGAIELLLGAALLALGAILAFTGVNIPLGITLMALGAASIWAAMKMDWDELKRQLQGPIGKILAIVSAALLVLGAILTFTGTNIPLGIALMAIGAAGLAVAIIANWDAIAKLLRGPIGEIAAIVSAALLVLGAILTFSGAAIPLGIGLMIAGAAGLAAVAAVNWETIKTKLQGPIGEITAIVSAALLVLGAILTFSGAAIPLGIGLMIAGAAGLATVAIVNWETIQTKLRGPIGAITAIVSGALLVLGAILTFTGAAIPLGIGLLIAGAVGLAGVVAVNWAWIVAKLRGTVGEVMAIVSAALLVLGIILVATGVGLPLGIALIMAGAAGLVTVTALNWDAIKHKIILVWESIKLWWQRTVAPIFTKEWWANTFQSIYDGLVQKMNDAIADVKKLYSAFLKWINGEGPGDVANWLGTQVGIGWDYQMPGFAGAMQSQMAAGAVVPTNPEFQGSVNGTVFDRAAQKVQDMTRANEERPVNVNVYLDSREIKSGQERLARVTGGGGR